MIYSVNGQLACVRATKTIQSGDEIIVNNGSSYFNPQECQCVTCETKSCGSFASRPSSVISHNIKFIVVYYKCYLCNMFYVHYRSGSSVTFADTGLLLNPGWSGVLLGTWARSIPVRCAIVLIPACSR